MNFGRRDHVRGKKFSHDINEDQRNNADLQNRIKSVKIQSSYNHQRQGENVVKIQSSYNHQKQGENVVVPRNMLEEIWTKLESLTQTRRF